MMKHKKLDRIDYVAPQVIDLGFPNSLYGQVTCTLPGSSATGDGCQPGNFAAGATNCSSGNLAQGSCHTGQQAQTTCEIGETAGNNCNHYGNVAIGRCNPNGLGM